MENDKYFCVAHMKVHFKKDEGVFDPTRTGWLWNFRIDANIHLGNEGSGELKESLNETHINWDVLLEVRKESWVSKLVYSIYLQDKGNNQLIPGVFKNPWKREYFQLRTSQKVHKASLNGVSWFP